MKAKDRDVPVPAIIGLAVVVVGIIGYFLYQGFLQPAPEVKVEELPPERLLDPDRGPSTTQAPQ